MRKFTNTEKSRGEMVIRELSEKAQSAYYGSDLNIYEKEKCIGEDEYGRGIYEKRYYIRGICDSDSLTLQELEECLESFSEDIDECEEESDHEIDQSVYGVGSKYRRDPGASKGENRPGSDRKPM